MGAPTPDAESPIVAGFERRVRDRGDDEALWCRGRGSGEGGRRLSFAELGERVGAWDRRLEGAGARAWPAAALALGNVAAFVELYLALRRRGVPVLALDGSLELAEQRRICRRLGVVRLLTAGPPSDAGGSGVAVEALGDGVALVDVGAEPVEWPRGTGLVKLTSGSTGEPAGACFTDACLETGIRQIAAGMEIREDDRVFLAIPISHSYGFDNGVLSLCVLGTPLILERRIFPADLLRGLEETRATFLPLVPPLVRSLGQREWPRGLADELALRTVICAGGRLLPSAARDFRRAAGLPVHDFYGSTETGGISYERDPEDPAAEGTVGHPLPGVRVELGPQGQVTVRSAANRIGTVGERRGDADAASPRPVRTGDRAEWTPSGRLRLVGRNDEILKVGGRKVAVAEMETALAAVDGVLEAAVVGVDDAVRGERTVAFLVADRWPVDTSRVPARLAPRDVRRVESLPHTSRGKLDRVALRERARSDRRTEPDRRTELDRRMEPGNSPSRRT